MSYKEKFNLMARLAAHEVMLSEIMPAAFTSRAHRTRLKTSENGLMASSPT
jgi:hypothetical protein